MSPSNPKPNEFSGFRVLQTRTRRFWIGAFLLAGYLSGFSSLAKAQPASTTSTTASEQILKGHIAPVLMGVFTPDGERAVTVSTDETAILWDLNTKSVLRSMKGHTGPLYCVAISGNGRLLVTGAQDNTLRMWALPQPRPVNSIKLGTVVQSLSRSRDGLMIIAGTSDHSAHLCDLSQFKLTNSTTQTSPAGNPTSLKAHASPVTATAYRSDGAMIATGDANGEIVLWNPFIDKPDAVIGNHVGGVAGLSFHSNNQHLVSSGSDGVLRVWQLPVQAPRNIAVATPQLFSLWSNRSAAVVTEKGGVLKIVDLVNRKTTREFPKQTQAISDIKVAPNDQLIALAHTDGSIQLVNSSDGKVRALFPGHESGVSGIFFHLDNKTLSSSGSDGTLSTWTIPPTPLPDTEELLPISSWKSPDGAISSLNGTRDGKKILVGSATGKLLIVGVADGKFEATLNGHREAIIDVHLSANSQIAVSSSTDGSAIVWSLGDSSRSHQLKHPASVTGSALTSDNSRLLTTCGDGICRIWDVKSGILLEQFETSVSKNCHAEWLADNKTVVTLAPEGQLETRRTAILRAFKVSDQKITTMTPYSGGNQFVVGTSDGKAQLIDYNNGSAVRSFEIGDHKVTVAISRSDNQRVAVGSNNGKVFIFNAGNAELLQTLDVKDSVTALAWSPDNQKLAVTTGEKVLSFFGPPLPPARSAPGNELVKHNDITTSSQILDLEFASDNAGVWAAHQDGTLAQWVYASPVQLRQFNHGGPVYAVAVSDDGSIVVTGSADQTVRIWEGLTGRQRFQMRGHQGAVHAIALDHSGSFVVSAGADRTLRLWDVTGGRQLKQLAIMDETQYAVSIHPNGKSVAAGGADRLVHVLNLLTGKTDRVLKGHTDYVHSVAFNSTGTRILSYSYSGDLRTWDSTNGNQLFAERIGRIGNYASYSNDDSRVLLSNGDTSARVVELPTTAR